MGLVIGRLDEASELLEANLSTPVEPESIAIARGER
jgi:hypothetical protein